MTDRAWLQGLADLEACCSQGAATGKTKIVRDRAYRADLQYLADERWLYAVSVARKRQFFPSIEDLEAWAAEMPATVRPSLALLPPAKLEAQREEGRKNARRGLEMIRAEMERAGVKVEPEGDVW